MSWLLDGRGLEILYKAQIHSFLEYTCLAWGGAANKHLALLDKVKVRAVRIIKDNNAGQEPHFTTLQHRRDVAGLTVVFKVQVKRVTHLQALWQTYRLAPVTLRVVALAPAIKLPRPPPPLHSTHVASHRQEQVTVPFSRTVHPLRSFLPRYGRLWNQCADVEADGTQEGGTE
ncbi:hypothetical protein GWK47_005053 [Chionoecetes opilio]|uniref:Uncharacterized protein n=1 Tax=Chionoecetes opilio TaxID=41210 RepID=A0A8J5CXC3_CHIOP|nr:hypothetical protein GWK47_005053 [Chionoecetes opilio]